LLLLLWKNKPRLIGDYLTNGVVRLLLPLLRCGDGVWEWCGPLMAQTFQVIIVGGVGGW